MSPGVPQFAVLPAVCVSMHAPTACALGGMDILMLMLMHLLMHACMHACIPPAWPAGPGMAWWGHARRVSLPASRDAAWLFAGIGL